MLNFLDVPHGLSAQDLERYYTSTVRRSATRGAYPCQRWAGHEIAACPAEAPLEQVRSVEQRNSRLIVEFGYVAKRLPPDYSGPPHLVTVGRLPDGKYQWEECPGPPPIGEESNRLLVDSLGPRAIQRV
jgi:hypothetical protein